MANEEEGYLGTAVVMGLSRDMWMRRREEATTGRQGCVMLE